MNKRGLAAGINVLSEGLYRESQARRDFQKRVELAVFNRELGAGNIEPNFDPNMSSDLSYQGLGFNRVSQEQKTQRQIDQLQQIQDAFPQQAPQVVPKIGTQAGGGVGVSPRIVNPRPTKTKSRLTPMQALKLYTEQPELMQDPVVGPMVSEALGIDVAGILPKPQQGQGGGGFLKAIYDIFANNNLGGMKGIIRPPVAYGGAPKSGGDRIVTNSKGQRGRLLPDGTVELLD